jgi:hypothetical protein
MRMQPAVRGRPLPSLPISLLLQAGSEFLVVTHVGCGEASEELAIIWNAGSLGRGARVVLASPVMAVLQHAAEKGLYCTHVI